MILQTSWVALYLTKWVGGLRSLSPSPSAGIFSRQRHLVLNVLFMVMTEVKYQPTHADACGLCLGYEYSIGQSKSYRPAWSQRAEGYWVRREGRNEE